MFISVYDVHSVVWRSVFFFFKQKTAYEMRISDWSSDVCSSDLPRRAGLGSAPCPDAAAEPETGRLYQRRLQLRPSIGIAVAGMHADHASLTVEGGAQRRREGQIVQPARKPERPGVAGLAAKRDLAVHRQAERQATQWRKCKTDEGQRRVRPAAAARDRLQHPSAQGDPRGGTGKER